MPELSGAATSELAQPHAALRASRVVLVVYLAALVLTPVMLLCAAFFIIPTRWYAARSGSGYLANIGYGTTLHNADCKVLLYGDSAATVGVDPLIIQQITGLPTCNIAEFEGMTIVNGTLIVDRFLANNPPPRYLVFLYSPENLNSRVPWFATFEAIAFRLRMQPDPAAILLLLRHPRETFSTLELGLRLGVTHALSQPFTEAQFRLREPHRGQLQVNGTTLTGCRFEPRRDDPEPAWIEHLRARYTTAHTRVLVDVFPLPACEASYLHFRQKLLGLTDNSLSLYPVDDYIVEGRLHMNANGSRRLSTDLAHQIVALEGTR